MKYEIEESDLQTIFQLLGEIPLKFSGPVFSKLQSSVKPQEKKPDNQEQNT